MKTTKLLILTCVLSLNTVFAQENSVNDDTQKAYEMPRTQVITIHNSETKAQNTLYIKLPEGYEENNNIKYPVIYFNHPVQHIEILSAAAEYIIEDVILVGLTWQKGMTLETLDSYLNFIRNDVFKTIENNYRGDADRRTYFAFSAGASVGAYILTKHPNTFKNFILGSPAFGVDAAFTRKIYELESNTAKERKKLNANVFISYGTLEGEDIKSFEKFITMLKNINDESLALQHIVVEGNHHTSFPMTAVRSVIWLSDLIKDDEFPVLKGPYFGQKPPGLIPEVFAPGIVSINGRSEGSISFTPDLDEIYFQADDENEKPTIYFSKLEGNKWTPIEKPAFTKGAKDEQETPFVSHNGKRIYFTAFSSDMSDTRIWYVSRLGHSWSDAIQLDLPNDDRVLLNSQTKKGDLHYFNFSKRKSYYATYSNGGFPEAKEFEIEPGLYHRFFSPNEDYFVAHGPNKEDEGRKDSDLSVSFKEQDGTWAKPINLGNAVNSNVSEQAPTITPDGKYMFFSRFEEDGTKNVYWVSTEVIENLRPK